MWWYIVNLIYSLCILHFLFLLVKYRRIFVYHRRIPLYQECRLDKMKMNLEFFTFFYAVSL